MFPDLGLHEYLPVPHRCHDWHGPRVQPLERVWQLVPRHEAADSAGHGEYQEAQPGVPRPARVYPRGFAILLVRAYGAVLERPTLFGVVFGPDHLVRG